jgi:DNA primase
LAEAFRNTGDVERVKDASDIVRIVGELVALKPKGREWVGLCPFHDDHRPSMNVIPAKQMFHCFVCQAGGDVLAFVQRFHRMEFREALEYLAEKANVKLTPRRRDEAGPSDSGAAIPRRDLLRANATALNFFRQMLSHEEHGKAARDLIARRAISPEMQEAFQLGAAPDRWDGLLQTLTASGIDPAPAAEVGLLKRRDPSSGSGFYDAFRNRVIFPIHDQIGRVIAFGGRRIRDDKDAEGNDAVAKYLNSAESRVFDKSSTLFALWQASRSIQSSGVAIVTEGYTDVIACHQAGFTNVVATLGTALTRQHATLLRRLCHTVVLLFDGDEAGERAGDRAFEKVFELLFKDVFIQEPLDVKVAMMDAFTDAKDPDELLKRPGGRDIFTKVLQSPTDLLTYRFSRLKERLRGAGISAVSRAIEEELGRLVELGLNECEPIRRRLLLKHIALVAGVDEATVQRVVPAGRGRRSPDPEPVQAARPSAAAALATAPLTVSQLALGCVLCEGDLWLAATPQERDLIGGAGYGSALLDAVHQAVRSLADSGRSPDVHAVLSWTEDQDVREVASTLWRRVDVLTGGDAALLREQWTASLTSLSRGDARRRAAGTPQAPQSMFEAASPTRSGASDADRTALAALAALAKLPDDQKKSRTSFPKPRT